MHHRLAVPHRLGDRGRVGDIPHRRVQVGRLEAQRGQRGQVLRRRSGRPCRQGADPADQGEDPARLVGLGVELRQALVLQPLVGLGLGDGLVAGLVQEADGDEGMAHDDPPRSGRCP